MPKFVARLVGVHPNRIDGMFLHSFDPEANYGHGQIIGTALRANAMQFSSAAEAVSLWETVPKSRPLRESDGRPNKPLTAFHMTVEPFEEDGKCSN